MRISCEGGVPFVCPPSLFLLFSLLSSRIFLLDACPSVSTHHPYRVRQVFPDVSSVVFTGPRHALSNNRRNVEGSELPGPRRRRCSVCRVRRAAAAQSGWSECEIQGARYSIWHAPSSSFDRYRKPNRVHVPVFRATPCLVRAYTDRVTACPEESFRPHSLPTLAVAERRCQCFRTSASRRRSRLLPFHPMDQP